jgi:hypothetical protein
MLSGFIASIPIGMIAQSLLRRSRRGGWLGREAVAADRRAGVVL